MTAPSFRPSPRSKFVHATLWLALGNLGWSTTAAAAPPTGGSAAASASDSGASAPRRQGKAGKGHVGGKPSPSDHEGAVKRDERGPTNTGTGTGQNVGPS